MSLRLKPEHKNLIQNNDSLRRQGNKRNIH